MKIFVCIKQVPDIDAPLHMKDGKLILDDDRKSMNAYDASAVEEALLLAEKVQGSVEVVLAGPEDANDTIRKALAMGAEIGRASCRGIVSRWVCGVVVWRKSG